MDADQYKYGSAIREFRVKRQLFLGFFKNPLRANGYF